MKPRTKHNKQGQGLIEAIVALGVIISGIIGMVNLSISNQISTDEAKEQLIATNFAREGIEVIRNIRDTNWLTCEINAGTLNCNTWNQGLSSGTDVTVSVLLNVSNNTWSLDFTANDIDHNHARIWRRNSGTAAEIGTHFQSTDNPPDNATLSGFNRLITLDSICTDKSVQTTCSGSNPKIGIKVQSTVQWTSKGGVADLVLEERLFNWR